MEKLLKTTISKILISSSPIHRSAYLPAKPFLLLLLLLFISLSAAPKDIFHLSRDQFFKALQLEDREFLFAREVSDRDIRKIHRLGLGGAYYTGRLYDLAGKTEPAEQFYRYEYEKGDALWKVEAGHRLLELLLKEERFEEAELLALDMMRTVLDTREVVRQHAVALYRQEKYEEVLGLTAGIPGYDERDLMHAVALRETGRSGWQQAVKALFTDYPASEIHSRLYLYLQYHNLLTGNFSEAEQKVFLWKHRAGTEDFGPAAEAVLDAAARYSGDPSLNVLLLEETAIRDLETTFRRSRYSREGVNMLEKLLSQLPDRENAPVYLLHTLGRLSMAGGDLSAAEEYFRRGMQASRSKGEHDRELWYMLYAAYQYSPSQAEEYIIRYAEEWRNPAYFADILEDVIAYRVRTGGWNALEELKNRIGGYIDRVSAQRLNLILSLAGEHGFLSDAEGRKRGTVKVPAGNGSYYDVLEGRMALPAKNIGGEAGEETEATLLEQFIVGHLDYGLYSDAAEAAEQNREELSAEVLRKIVVGLSDHGYFREGILLSRRLARKYPEEMDTSVYQRVYPRGYADLVQRQAARQGIPEHLLNALIRVESAFDKDISSHAGAVGLTQLMPATAREAAGKLGLTTIDLTDAEFSITVGASYYAEMYRRFGSYLYALFAYNAGPGRMRSWLRSFGHLPPALFLEALPFRETREYGRKVLVTTAYYRYLYENRPIRESVSLFFPDHPADL